MKEYYCRNLSEGVQRLVDDIKLHKISLKTGLRIINLLCKLAIYGDGSSTFMYPVYFSFDDEFLEGFIIIESGLYKCFKASIRKQFIETAFIRGDNIEKLENTYVNEIPA